jgi:hypothetical protein
MGLTIEEVRKVLVGVGLDITLKQPVSTSGRWSTHNIIDPSQDNQIFGVVYHTEGAGLGVKNFVYPDDDVIFGDDHLEAFTKIVAANI